MRVVVLGSGTSHGIPVIGCDCAVCKSSDPKDSRMRCSIYVECAKSDGNSTRILVDAGPEFRLQAIRAKITGLDAVLITHSHADHLHGLDDLRIFSYKRWHGFGCNKDVRDPSRFFDTKGKGLALYASESTCADILRRFDYVFKSAKKGGGTPKLNLKSLNSFNAQNPLKFENLCVIPIPMRHGTLKTTGFLFCEECNGEKKSFAYLTDCNFLGTNSLKTIQKNAGQLEHIIIDGMRDRTHQTHFSFAEGLKLASTLGAKHIWLTHICHDMSHREITQYIADFAKSNSSLKLFSDDKTAAPAYDGLEFEI